MIINDKEKTLPIKPTPRPESIPTPPRPREGEVYEGDRGGDRVPTRPKK